MRTRRVSTSTGRIGARHGTALLAGFAVYLTISSGCLSPPRISESEDAGVDAADMAADATEDVAANDAQTTEDVTEPDVGPCGGCPDGEVCATASDECVECVADSDCPSQACEPTSQTCVECVSSTSCVQGTASRCADNFACAACEVDADCGHILGLPACLEGVCVECTPDNDDACGGNACNPRQSTCTQTPLESLTTCLPCVTDAECVLGSLCVVMQYDGAVRNAGDSGYCLPIFTGAACELTTGWTTMSADLPSIDDPTPRNFCAPNQMNTTCEAVLDWGKTCNSPDECGVETADGRCEATNGGMATLCTFECTTAQDCPEFAPCGSAGICGLP